VTLYTDFPRHLVLGVTIALLLTGSKGTERWWAFFPPDDEAGALNEITLEHVVEGHGPSARWPPFRCQYPRPRRPVLASVSRHFGPLTEAATPNPGPKAARRRESAAGGHPGCAGRVAATRGVALSARGEVLIPNPLRWRWPEPL
jgi:hypothetical protein